MWRSDDRGDSWRPISGDLSRGQDRLTLPMMDRVWSYDAIWDLWAMSNFGNVTSLSESPLVEGLLYAGTDDGLVQVSENGGESWRQAGSLPGVPEGSFVNDIKADQHDADTVYVALDNHKQGDFQPYLLKSTDRGRSWADLAGDLPDRHLVWRLVQDHVDPDLLFVGTELGVFFSANGGGRWVELTGGVPNIPFRDLAIQARENDLVGATFGRGFYVLDDYSPLRDLSEEALDQEARLFPVKDAWWYIERRTLGASQKASQGDAFYTAPNPPFGAVFTYYLRDGYETREARRQKSEKEIAEAGGDTPYPGWDELHREAREEDPRIELTVRSADGDVVRRLTGPATPGFHRVAWDLRYPDTDAWNPDPEVDFFGTWSTLAFPGSYSVTLAKRVDGTAEALGEPQSFEVVPLTSGTLQGMSYEKLAGFFSEYRSFRLALSGAGATLEQMSQRLRALRESMLSSAVEDEALEAEVRALESRLLDTRQSLFGDPLKDELGEPAPPGIAGRLQVVEFGNRFSTYGPTPTHLRVFEIAKSEFAAIESELNRIFETELPALEKRLEAAGIRWTPGRGVPSPRAEPQNSSRR